MPGGHSKTPDLGALATFRHIGFGILALQGIGLLIWSSVLYHRFAVGSDFAGYHQAWYLIAHGNLNPVVSVWGGHEFLRSHAELIIWLLAPLWWLWHSGLFLLWIQDAAIVTAEAVAFIWICEVAAERRGRGAWQLAALGLFFMVANPWMYWAASFDFHAEVLGACFAMLAAFDLADHRNRAWVWVAFTLACGDVSSTYIAGVGISAVLAGKPWRRNGLICIGIGAVFTGIVTLIGANAGSGLTIYSSSTHSGAGTFSGHRSSSGVKGVSSLLSAPFRAPRRFFHDLWPNKLNVYANLAPAGGIGIFSAWGFGVPIIIILENNLRPAFSVTAAQNFPMYCFVSLGTVMVLAKMARWRPLVATVVAIVLALSTLGWFLVWFPRTSSQWLRTSPQAAATISRGTASIPASAQIVASHGVEGALSGRTAMSTINPGVPVTAKPVYFVVTPAQGIETKPLTDELAELASVAHMGGRLVASGGGAWVLKWSPPPRTKVANLSQCTAQPAWALQSNAGHAITTGPAAAWGMVADGHQGYVVYGDYAREAAGRYNAEVTLTSHGPLSVEVWDNDRNVLLARRIVSATGTRKHILVPFVAPTQFPRPTTSGSALFKIVPIPPPPNDQVEIRIYSAGGVQAKVTSLNYHPATASGPAAEASC